MLLENIFLCLVRDVLLNYFNKTSLCEQLIYIDEIGTDDNISQLRGYSEKGSKSFGKTTAFKKERLSTIAGYHHSTHNLITPF